MSTISKFKDIVSQIPGWRTKRKIVVFQSDDWGSIRMPNTISWELLNKRSIKVNDKYNTLDSIETESDLENLFDVLSEVKDINGQNPCLTANCLVANPDFDQIKRSGFRNYEFELVSKTFEKYNGSDTVKKYWIKGNESKIFVPQFHGREHLNVNLWMNALAQGKEETLEAFNLNAFGIYTDTTSEKRKHYLAAFDLDHKEELNEQTLIINNGLKIFENLMGYKSKSFIPPNYVFSSKLNHVLIENGVFYFQTQRFQLDPNSKKGYNQLFRFTGQKSKEGLKYLVRNCHFEPFENPLIDWFDSCLADVKLSFALNKPAIISTHRVNFMSRLNIQNRDRNLKSFKKLLLKIRSNWPDVEFLSTCDLGELI